MTKQPVIEMKNVTKAYRGVPAVKNVSFTLLKGEIHALLGENGAGKSTLTKIMAGVVQASEGEMLHNGAAANFASPSRRCRTASPWCSRRRASSPP